MFKRSTYASAVGLVVGIALATSACTATPVEDQGSSQGERRTGSVGSERGVGSQTDADAPAPADSLEVPKKKIGLLIYVGASYIQKQLADEFVRAATALGWEVIVQDAQGQPGLLASISQSFVQQKVDAFVSIAAPPSSILPALQSFKKSGTPVVGLSGYVPDDDNLIAAIFRPSEAVQSVMAADWVGVHVPPGSDVIMQNFDPQQGVRMRSDVFRPLMDLYGMNVVAEHQIDPANLVSDTINSVRDQLAANPDVKVIFSSIDAQLAPICNLLKEKGRTDIVVLSQFTFPDTAKALETCKSAVVLDATNWYTGWHAADALLHHFVKGTEISADVEVAKYPHIFKVVTSADMPAGAASYPFPDIGKKIYADWETQGYQLEALPEPTTATE